MCQGWRRDVLRAQGFDERMRYGGEDRELGGAALSMQVSTGFK